MPKLYIGTSGYNYEDWKGSFYPEQLDEKEYLGYYSTFFNTVELNFTYYCFPSSKVIDVISQRVGENFIFSVKSNSIFTHQRNYTSNDIKKFLDPLKTLVDNKKFGSILFQFPWSFTYSSANLNYLSRLAKDFDGHDMCFEFRNNCWLNETVLNKLKEDNIGFCNVDEPQLKGLLPITDINTSSSGYIRFHGRNKEDWWDHESAFQRYDYMYKQEELCQWISPIKKIMNNSKKTFIYFNNHYKGKAGKSA
ncbi:MAG: DUF72 domain-containing protein, partial [Actinobacteria bacterium]|nr:DUF72 domain-containing protein [Actinomycetota bacterium]